MELATTKYDPFYNIFARLPFQALILVHCILLCTYTHENKNHSQHSEPVVHGLWPEVDSYGDSSCLTPKDTSSPTVVYSCYDDSEESDSSNLSFEVSQTILVTSMILFALPLNFWTNGNKHFAPSFEPRHLGKKKLTLNLYLLVLPHFSPATRMDLPRHLLGLCRRRGFLHSSLCNVGGPAQNHDYLAQLGR